MTIKKRTLNKLGVITLSATMLAGGILPITGHANNGIVQAEVKHGLTRENPVDVEELQEFLDEGHDIVELDELIQERGLTTSAARLAIKTAATVTSISLPRASELLKHSLQDKPSAKSFADGVGLSASIKGSKAYTEVINAIKTKLKTSTATSVSGSGDKAFTKANSGNDIYLAVSKMKYTYTATRSSKTSKTWKITVKFTDVYNFEKAAWSGANSYGSTVTTAINNIAVYAQQKGVIVPYNVTVNTSKTVTL